jgi:putative flippase GtrA
VSAPAASQAPPRVGLFRGLYERFQHLVKEVGKFGVVGAVCYAIDVGVFALCVFVLGLNSYLALVISTVISTTCAFTGNRFWTWRDRERTSLHREYLLYFGFNLVGLGIGYATLFVSHNLLGAVSVVFATKLADTISTKFFGVAFASLFRFWAYRKFIFKVVASDAA